MNTPITNISGIGPSIAGVLAKHGYNTAEDIAASDVKALCVVPGFGPIKAKTTISAAVDLLGKEKKDASKTKKKKVKAKPKSKPKTDKKKKKKDSKKGKKNKKSDKNGKSRSKSKSKSKGKSKGKSEKGSKKKKKK